jgi:hypothetical protein
MGVLQLRAFVLCCGGSSAASLLCPTKPNPAIRKFPCCGKDSFNFRSSRADKDDVISNLGIGGIFLSGKKSSARTNATSSKIS